MTTFYGRTVAFLASIKGTRFRALMASSGISTALIIVTATAGGHSNEFTDALKALAGAAPAATPVATPVSTPAPTTGGGGGASPAPRIAPSAVPASTTPSAGGGDTTPAPKTKPKRVKHVWVISLASPGYDASFGTATKMPYLSGALRPQGELLDNYSLLSSSALPNYIAMTSGQPPNAATRGECSTYTSFPAGLKPGADGVVAGDACIYPDTTPTVTDGIDSAGLTWRAYMEDMAQPCQRPAPGAADDTAPATTGYVTRHNPFAYYDSGIQVGDCTSYDLPLTRLTPDLSKTTSTPNFSFISPNLCHDGVEGPPCASGDPGGPASSDAFLQTLIPQIQASAAYEADGLIVITFGETFPKDPSDTAQVGTLLLSKFLTPGATRSDAFNPYSLLRSLQDIFGTKHYAMANSTTLSFAPEVLGPAAKAKKKKRKK
ncbi:MAG: hypothetical protein QOD60_1508 [Solirubrobacterales bacterium]|nr:hypothetical protein [Solirubrobacterales bacterium]